MPEIEKCRCLMSAEELVDYNRKRIDLNRMQEEIYGQFSLPKELFVGVDRAIGGHISVMQMRVCNIQSNQFISMEPAAVFMGMCGPSRIDLNMRRRVECRVVEPKMLGPAPTERRK